MITKLIVVLLVVSFRLMDTAFAQRQKEYILLSGTIENVNLSPEGKRVIELKPPFGVSQPTRTILLTQTGSFADTLIGSDGEYTLWDGKNPVSIYLHKARTYRIRYDANHFRDGYVELGGDDLSINRYFVTKQQKKTFIDRLNLNRSEEQFTELIGQLRHQALQRLQTANLPEVLSETEAKSLQYEYLSELYLFLALKKEADPSFEASVQAKKELAINYLNEADYRHYGYYQKLVYEYYQTQLKQLAKEQKKVNPTYSLEQHEPQLLYNRVPNAYIRNHLIAQRAMFGLKQAGDLEAFYRDFKRYYTGKDAVLRAEMVDAYWRLSKLKVGKASPEFSNYRNYTGGQSSLKDFRGQFVYIDLWATGPATFNWTLS